MKKAVICSFFLSIVLSFSSFLYAQDMKTPPKKEPYLKNKEDSLSYILGVAIAYNMKSYNFDTINYDIFIKAVKDYFNKKELINQNYADKFIGDYREEFTNRIKRENLEKGKKFMDENKKKPGVKETESGLQYEVLIEGDGEIPVRGKFAKMVYRGTLIDGKEFDSYSDKDNPVTMPVVGLIKGWQEAVRMMKVGSKYRIVMPPRLGYGDKYSDKIPENSVLIMEIELLGVE